MFCRNRFPPFFYLQFFMNTLQGLHRFEHYNEITCYNSHSLHSEILCFKVILSVCLETISSLYIVSPLFSLPPPSLPPSFMKLSYCTVTVWTICLRMTSFTFKKHLFLFRLLNHNPFAFGGNIHKNWNESLELLHAVIVQHQVYVGRPSY